VVAFSWAEPAFHPVPFVAAAGALAWYHEATARVASHATKYQRMQFGLGIFAVVFATIWPIADLAQTVSLLAIVLQREILVLAAAPLLLMGLPTMVAARLTRPAPIDWVASRLAKPVPALVTTSILLGVTALPFAVDAANSDGLLRGFIVLVTLFAGLVLWLPVIERIPDMHRLSPIAKGGYLVAQSLAPTFLSFAWIFALRPLYGSLHGQRTSLGLSPLADQQLSGYLSKLGTFGVLWIVAFILFVQAPDEAPSESGPLHWVDVERALERAERKERKVAIRPEKSGEDHR
jgi:putative membrane protein